MIEFSLVRSILSLKMLKYVSMALASRMICVYDMFTIFAWFGFLFSPSCSIVSNYVLFFLLLFVVVSEKQTWGLGQPWRSEDAFHSAPVNLTLIS